MEKGAALISHSIFILQSPVSDGGTDAAKTTAYLDALGTLAGHSFFAAGADDAPGEFPVVFAEGGGTAGALRRLYEKSGARRWLILHTGRGNALSASLQMATFLREQGAYCRILCGSPEEVAPRLTPYLTIMRALNALRETRVASVGTPSDWLVAGDTDRAGISARFGLEFMDIPIAELEAEYRAHGYARNPYTEAILKKAPDTAEALKALHLYGALERLCTRHRLGAVTVRCFDLLSSIQTSGCLAMAILNTQGVVAGCEADMPSLISMLLLSRLTDGPAFMCNPSLIDAAGNEMVFAHCTLPLNMADEYSLPTHFESGSSVAVRGILAQGPVTVFKLSADGGTWFASNGILTGNPDNADFCRTQVRIRLDRDVSEFLTAPIGNHYVICHGAYAALVEEFLRITG